MRDAQAGRTYPVEYQRGCFLSLAYPARFRWTDESLAGIRDAITKVKKESDEMPKMPTPASLLEDDTYNFKVESVKTTEGQYGKQEEIILTVCDDDWEETRKKTRCWIGHNQYKLIKNALAAGVLSATWDAAADPEEDDPVSWEVKVPCMFRGVVLEGKIKKFKRA